MRAAYERLLARRPILVKAATGLTLGLSGDAAAQLSERRAGADTAGNGAAQSTYDYRRGAAFGSLGMFWNGPFMHHYFGALERHFPQKGGGVRVLLIKTSINQLLMNPIVWLPLFYGWTGLVLGRTVSQSISKAKNEYAESLRATWMIFTPVNIINFYFVPVRHQVLVNAWAGFVYNTTLSLIAGSGHGG